MPVDAAALVLVVPVALGVAVGGFPVAPVGVLAGFFAFDFFFIPPYYDMTVGAGEHWVSIGVYTAVSLIVGGVVAQAQASRRVAHQRESEVRLLYELARAVAAADGLDAALHAVARLARTLFDLATVAILLLDGDGGLRVAACEGTPLPERDVRRVAVVHGADGFGEVPGAPGLLAGPLPTASGPAGLVVVSAAGLSPERLRLLSLFATQAGVAVERARLAEETARAQTLAEIDRLRSSLVGAVSHDLRTPLASIKAAVSDLVDPSVPLDEGDRRVLLATIEEETDRLTRFVTNLLDMSRIESGALRVGRSATPVDELIEQALVRFAPMLGGPVSVQVPENLPLLDVDYVLIEQVFSNLFENVVRHCPPGTAVDLEVVAKDHWAEIRVADDGPGIPAAERQRIFALFSQGISRGGGGTGMGLAICRGIIEAHGGQLWVEQRQGGGSVFVFRLPVVAVPADAEIGR